MEIIIMESVTIRRVAKGDEHILAYIQTESWKAAFRDIIPEDLLAKYTQPEKAAEMYRKLLEDGKGNGYLLEVNGKPHCIAYWDATRESDMPGYAELICIHSLQDQWHRGYGSKMMDRVFSDVQKAGYSKIMLWVFEKNRRAIEFYKAKGFTASGRFQSALGAAEVMYVKEF